MPRLAVLRELVERLFPPAAGPWTTSERQQVAESRVRTIYIHAHMDEDTFDCSRAMLCPDLVPAEPGRLIPACTYNLFYRSRTCASSSRKRHWRDADAERAHVAPAAGDAAHAGELPRPTARRWESPSRPATLPEDRSRQDHERRARRLLREVLPRARPAPRTGPRATWRITCESLRYVKPAWIPRSIAADPTSLARKAADCATATSSTCACRSSRSPRAAT